MALNKNIKIDLKVKKSKEESNLYSVDDQEARNVIEEISQSLREENKPVHKSNILRECLRFKREGEISKELMSRIKEQLK